MRCVSFAAGLLIVREDTDFCNIGEETIEEIRVVGGDAHIVSPFANSALSESKPDSRSGLGRTFRCRHFRNHNVTGKIRVKGTVSSN